MREKHINTPPCDGRVACAWVGPHDRQETHLVRAVLGLGAPEVLGRIVQANEELRHQLGLEKLRQPVASGGAPLP